MNDRLRPSVLATSWLGHELRALDDTASTNAALAQWAVEGAPHGSTLIAARQHGGRGRQGRHWSSPPGNLYVSWLLRPRRAMAEMAPLSLVTGLSVATALRDGLGLTAAGLKWPNDVWIGTRKVAGVLLESRVHPSPTIVVGLGLNLRTPTGGWSGELAGRATALDEHGLEIEPAQALELLLPQAERDIERFEAAGLAEFTDELHALSVLDGRRVHVLEAQREEDVDVIAIAEDGGLRVRSSEGRERVLYAGEVHLGGMRS